MLLKWRRRRRKRTSSGSGVGGSASCCAVSSDCAIAGSQSLLLLRLSRVQTLDELELVLEIVKCRGWLWCVVRKVEHGVCSVVYEVV